MNYFYNIHTHCKNNNPNTIAIRSFSIDEPHIDTSHLHSIGVHPWYINDFENQLNSLIKMSSSPKLAAIGEAGLDTIRGPELKIQIKVFEKQAALSEKIAKPLIIHCVKAYHHLLQLKNLHQPTQPWIIHGFKGKTELAMQLINNGFYLSAGCYWLEFEKRFADFLKAIPASRLFFETDDEPDEKLAAIYQLAEKTIPGITKTIAKNFISVFEGSAEKVRPIKPE